MVIHDEKVRERTYMDFLVLEEGLAELECLPALVIEAFIALPTDLVLYNFRKARHEDLFDCVFLLTSAPTWV